MTTTLSFRKFPPLVLFLFVLNTLTAQQGSIKHNAANSIGFGSHLTSFYLHDQKVGLADIKPLLLQYPSSTGEYAKYRKQNAVSTTILILADVAAVIAIFQSQSFSSCTPYLGGFVGGLAIGIPLSISAKKHLRHGALLYNQELLK